MGEEGGVMDHVTSGEVKKVFVFIPIFYTSSNLYSSTQAFDESVQMINERDDILPNRSTPLFGV